MSVRDIQSEMEELYGIDVSPAMISKITDKVVEATAEWQSRELDKRVCKIKCVFFQKVR